MGLFNSYLKEGPGVDKNEKRKKGIFLYFEIVFAKFFKFLRANSLVSLVSLPYFAIAFFFLCPMVMRGFGLDTILNDVIQQQGVSGENAALIKLALEGAISVMLFNFFGSGPASAAYAYITRCYTRAEHAWILSDSKDKFKENFKNSALLFIADVFVIVLVMNAVYFYGQYALEASGGMAMMFTYIKFFAIMVFIVYMMMHIYAYQLMVTYECNFRMLIKSSFMFTIAKLPMNIILSAVSLALIFIPMQYFHPLIAVLFYMIVGMTFTRFPLEFCAARVIEKNIKATQNSSNTEEETTETYEKVFEDSIV
jgi:uncharacterized membrane protein YesL